MIELLWSSCVAEAFARWRYVSRRTRKDTGVQYFLFVCVFFLGGGGGKGVTDRTRKTLPLIYRLRIRLKFVPE